MPFHAALSPGTWKSAKTQAAKLRDEVVDLICQFALSPTIEASTTGVTVSKTHPKSLVKSILTTKVSVLEVGAWAEQTQVSLVYTKPTQWYSKLKERCSSKL